MLVSQERRSAVASRLKAKASKGLRQAMQKWMSILPDFDPMVQVIGLLLIMKMADGFTLDKDTVVGTGMLVMMLFEELM